MDLGRLRASEWFAGSFGAGLIGLLFADWYLPGRNAWETFAVTDIVLLLAGVMGIGTLVLTATQHTAAVPTAFESLTALVATLASLFALVAMLNLPDGAIARDIGPGLALPLTLGIALAAWFGIRNERPGRRIPGRPLDVERFPAPDA